METIILIPSYEPDDKLIKLLKSIDKSYHIIVVDDGSGENYSNIYEEAHEYAHVISYEENKGKGYALKKGLKYIKDKYKNYIVVTMDSDGQHRIEDAKKLIEYASNNIDTLVIGKRNISKSTPIRSKIGNYLIRRLYKKTTNIDIYDTQSGLRAFSYKLIDYILFHDFLLHTSTYHLLLEYMEGVLQDFLLFHKLRQ